MTDPHPPGPDRDHLGATGGAGVPGPSGTSAVTDEVAALRRRTRRFGVMAGVALVAAIVAGAVAVDARRSGDGGGNERGRTADPSVDRLLASLGDEPVDPTRVKLVSTVSTFPDCDALVGDLRRVGAAHVGSRGFGGFDGFSRFSTVGASIEDGAASRERAPVPDGTALSLPATGSSAGPGETLGTNVQVAGVDELDHVKAVGDLIYDLDPEGHLRITDAGTLAVRSTLDVSPGVAGPGDPTEGSKPPKRTAWATQLLVADGRVVVFGSEVEVSDPVAGDPSATRSSTEYLTVAFVDASDPGAPKLTDRVRVEGSLVSARLVAGQVRLVATSNMADLGFVMPTTPGSVRKALEQNRRSVASSTAADWIPDWQREGQDPQPLVPCERVHVPDTFAGVAMTSMVAFPLAAGRFEPQGTSVLAPGSTLYAGLDTVAISSEVWVDPVDRERLEFDDWKTAIHEFTFAGKGTDASGDAGTAPPRYEGSGIVEGSTVGQFAFGEIGDSLAVVTTAGTPWKQGGKAVVDLTVLSPDGHGKLAETASVDDLSDGRGAVAAVRFVEGRVLVSTGAFGRQVVVLDVTDPAAPRRAGAVTLPGDVGYFHPLPGDQALLIGSRFDQVGTGRDERTRTWVQAHLLDVADPDAPKIVATWERPWSSDAVSGDHHAFTYWPTRKVGMWGVHDTQGDGQDRPNHAVVLATDGTVREVAVPEAHQPPEAPSPCPAVEITDPEVRRMLGAGSIVLRCADRATREVDWPRYQCYRADDGLVARYAPGQEDEAAFFVCSKAPRPSVSRVLVVAGRPILLTDQTLEALDPTTFASTAVAYHPGGSARYAY